MPSAPDNHEAHDYAERIRERLPRRLQELREAAGLSKDALAKKSGVSRDMVGCIEEGESIPTLSPSIGNSSAARWWRWELESPPENSA